MHKIYLTEDDTADSIIGRIRSSPESDIDLIIFSETHPELSIVNLKLFNEAAISLGKTIAISTNDEAVKLLAEKAQLNVKLISGKFNNFKKTFPSSSEFPGIRGGIGNRPTGAENLNMNNNHRSVDSIGFIKKHESMPEKFVYKQPESLPNECARNGKDMAEFSVSGTNKSLFAIFLVLALIVAGALVYVLLPTAQIIITPKTEPMSASFDFVLDKNISILNKAEKIVPASVIVADVEKNGQFNATGKKQITAKAGGIATIYNEWSSFPQNLVASTRVLAANGKLFRTVKTVVVPGFIRDENGNDVPGTIDVPIIAAEAGPDYNIDPTDFTIPGFKGTSKFQKIYAKSVEPTSGGALGFATVVSDTDLKKAKDYLAEQAKKDLLIQLNDKKPSDLVMLSEAVSIDSGDFTTAVKADQVVSKFNASLKTSAAAFLFNPIYVKEIANEIFVSMGREKKSVMISDSSEVDYANVSVLPPDKIKMTAAARAFAYNSIDADQIRGKLVGKSKEEVGEYVKSNTPEIDRIKITLWPFWAKKIPIFERNINIKISLDIPEAR